MLRLHVLGPLGGAYHAFEAPAVRVGSHPDSDIVLPAAAGVRLRHAVFRVSGGQMTVENVSTNAAVEVAGQAVVRSAVEPGSVVRVGSFSIEVLDRDPPSEPEQYFLSSIARSPKDDGVRAVYADWLEEQGRIDEARFLRAQVELRALSPGEPRFRELSIVLGRLARPLSHAWRRAVAWPAIESCDVRFELQCPKTWDQLRATARPDERFCDACAKPVYYVTDIASAQRRAAAGQCVAVDIVLRRQPGDLRPPAPPMMMMKMGAIAPPGRR